MEKIVVVGAGLAGAAAACKLAAAGRKVVLLEARDRIGGRAFSRPFGKARQDQEGQGLLEYGGSWITPWHGRLRALAATFGQTLRPRHAVTNRMWNSPDLHLRADPSNAIVKQHDMALARIAADAILYKKGMTADEKGRTLTGISYGDYMNRVNPPKHTRDLMNAWWAVSGNGPHDRVAATEFLGSCAYGDGLAEAMIDAWSHSVEPGMAELAKRMIVESGAELHLDEPVVGVSQSDHEVQVTTRSGRAVVAARAILALGINQMRTIEFLPGLRPAMAKVVSHGHLGCAFKLWIKVRGVAVGTLVTGDSTGIELLFAERAAEDGTTLLIGFGLDQNGVDPGNPAWVRQQLAKLAPNAQYVDSDWHDWMGDPFARGTWVAMPTHLAAEFDSQQWRPQGRVAFASSDYASDQAGWFEGAVIAGEAAADWVLNQ